MTTSHLANLIQIKVVDLSVKINSPTVSNLLKMVRKKTKMPFNCKKKGEKWPKKEKGEKST